MKKPKVTVLMPVYNGEQYLKEAIESVLQQSFTDFEFLIINDGSTDNSEKIICSFSDSRIKFINNGRNRGLSATLNRGLSLAQGNYIARMDCDDLSAKTRLEKQVSFLNDNPEYGIVGTLFGIINEDRKIREIGGVKLLEDEDLKLGLLFGNVFCHGETMFRRKIIEKYELTYNSAFTPCEDYELWVRMSKLTKFKTLQEILYFYMVHGNGMSGMQSDKMKQQVDNISQRLQKQHGFALITPHKALQIYSNGQNYKDQFFTINNRKVMAYVQLAYQVFMFRLGKIYLSKKRFDGILLFVASFFINPLNWFRHIFKLFPK